MVNELFYALMAISVGSAVLFTAKDHTPNVSNLVKLGAFILCGIASFIAFFIAFFLLGIIFDFEPAENVVSPFQILIGIGIGLITSFFTSLIVSLWFYEKIEG